MIIGRDLLDELGMNFLFSSNLMEWDNASTPMLDPDLFDQEDLDELANEVLYICMIQTLLKQKESKRS